MLYDWYAEKRDYKTVKLMKVYMCKSITCNDIIQALNELEWYAWRQHLSYILSDAVLKAFEKQEDVADITKMFSRDLFAFDRSGEHTRSQEEIHEILMKRLFKKESETSEVLTVSLRWGAI